MKTTYFLLKKKCEDKNDKVDGGLKLRGIRSWHISNTLGFNLTHSSSSSLYSQFVITILC